MALVCEDANVTVGFIGPNGDHRDPFFEARPLTMDFKRDLGEFDFARCKFSQDVTERLEPHLDAKLSIFNSPLPVVIYFNGNPVHRLAYFPDGATMGVDKLHLEFHDIRKFLQRGVVDYQRESVKLEEAFEYIFKRRDTSGPAMFNGIRFTVPDEAYEELIAFYDENLVGGDIVNARAASLADKARDGEDPVEGSGDFGPAYDSAVAKLEEERVYNIIDGHYAVNYEQTSPWEAIRDLADKFGVRTWVAPDGYLYVGSRKATGIAHMAAPDDSRVWKLLPDEYNITPPRDPVIKSVVRGKMVDDPSETWAENAIEFVTHDRNTKDYRAEGVAVRSDRSLGQEIVNNVDAAKDALEALAVRKLMEAQREQWSGSISLLPSQSGSQWTNIENVQVGDDILTIPDDDTQGGCRSTIGYELFEVTGVQHKITDSGSWKTNLSVIPFRDGPLDPSNIDSYMRYFDPHAEEFLDEKNAWEKKKDDRSEDFWKNMW